MDRYIVCVCMCVCVCVCDRDRERDGCVSFCLNMKISRIIETYSFPIVCYFRLYYHYSVPP